MSHARYALSDDEDEVPRPTQPSSSYASIKENARSSPEALPLGLDIKEEPLGETRSSIVRLAHAWLDERGSPEVQPWNASMVEEVMDQIGQQQSILDSLASDASTSEEEHFRLNLVQLDVERAKWLLRNYLRSRLAKVRVALIQIETYAAYIMSHRSEQQRLSDIEFHQLNTDHFQSTVLQFLPEPMRGLDDAAPVTAPNLGAPVFVYCREDCGALPLPNDETAQLAQGTIHLLQYRDVRAFLQQRRVELL
ncbi:SLD5 [Malassezia furfur]|nr:SLD5 [Malassezia furfur]